MGQREVFVGEGAPVDGASAGAVIVGEVTPLAHELGDDAVEAASLVTVPLLGQTQLLEVLSLSCPASRRARKRTCNKNMGMMMMMMVMMVMLMRKKEGGLLSGFNRKPPIPKKNNRTRARVTLGGGVVLE